MEKQREIDEACYHCGLPILGADFSALINKKAQPMCCAGCQAVAEAIVDSGMGSYYQFRETSSDTAKELVPEFLLSLQAYDNPLIQKQFVFNSDESSNLREVSLILEGIVCAACVWLNEQYLSQLEGITKVKINYSTHRASVQWDNEVISLSEILESISRIGYLAHPYDPQKQQQVFEKQRTSLLKKIGVSGLLGMQVMVFSVALYGGDYWGISDDFKILFRWLALFLTMPVLFYAAQPFFKGAYTDLKNRRAGMDVPVTLGISLAFFASLYHTVMKTGDVYFDSVCMFVFLLLGVRYIELMARKKSAENIERLADLSPAMAHLLAANNEVKIIPIAELNEGDEILVRSGESVPADGLLLSIKAEMDESLLTGESTAVNKQLNDSIIAGSLNLGQSINVKVTKIGQETVLSGILRLIDDAQNHKPRIAIMADKVAAKFVLILLVLVAVTGSYWFFIDPAQSLQIMVATLVVTCPCALSLATPAAVSATIGRSSALGVLVAKTDALEQLPKVDVFLFDKTGTLTQGNLSIESINVLGDKEQSFYSTLAMSMEVRSEHPIARAFTNLSDKNLALNDFKQITNQGVKAEYAGETYYLGSLSWMRGQLKNTLPIDDSTLLKAVYLFSKSQHLATFYLNDPLKEDAEATVKALQSKNKKVVLLSGDQEQTVRTTAAQLGISEYLYEQLPQQKLDYLKSLQNKGLVVAMVGDGINDAPVLAAADVAISMSSGTDLATAASDLVIKGLKTQPIIAALQLSQSMNLIIKQNFAWAIGYNLVAIPFAVSGLLAPWLAAIGMSISSLVVVINAMRLKY